MIGDLSKIIILDRDGVINFDSDDYIKSVEEWNPIPNSIEAIARLSRAGYRVFIATNQSGIARKFYDVATLDAMHEKMFGLLNKVGGNIEGIVYCPHLPSQKCSCRKPAVGLLIQIEASFGVSLQGCSFVGDSLKDLECASAFGCQPILVKTGKGEGTAQCAKDLVRETPTFDNLACYVDSLLGES